MIKDEWQVITGSKASHAYTRWINQFIEFAGKKTREDILNQMTSNEQIEHFVFDWMQSLKQTETESTINQKISALVFFYEIHNIPFLSKRIIESFSKKPLYYTHFTIDLIQK